MEDFGVLELFTYDPCDSQRLSITSTCHDYRESKKRRAQKREELILINSIFVERVICELALSDFDRPQVIDVVSYESEGSLVASARVSQRHCHQGSCDHGKVNTGYCLIVNL